jgi:hypothetical protein
MNSVICDRTSAVVARLALLLGTSVLSLSAHAALTVSTAAGAAPAGVHYVNFDDMSYQNPVSGGVSVTFTPNSGLNIGAAPYLTNSNGLPFGDATVSGPDATQFLFSGSPVTLGMPGEEHYFGILWGSVDAINSLSFYAADGTLVGVVSGNDVAPAAHGSWESDGTVYVNVDSSLGFTSVVVDSGGGLFEFDNVAYNATVPTVSSVPEPTGATLLLGGLLAGSVLARKRRAR